MGGYNSGRRAMQPVVEHGLTLEIGRLLRHRNLLPGGYMAGTLIWTRQPSGERVADIGYEADMRDRHHAWMRLRYTLTRWGDFKTTHDYRVTLTTTVPPFGGVRWWFVCPRTGRLAAKLYQPPGAEWFASRWAFRMAYESQRYKALFRAQSREARVVRKLGAVYERPDTPMPPRPKWMRHKTYDRLCAELAWWQAAQGWAFVADTERVLARWGRVL